MLDLNVFSLVNFKISLVDTPLVVAANVMVVVVVVVVVVVGEEEGLDVLVLALKHF
jgi:hypothetical protein